MTASTEVSAQKVLQALAKVQGPCNVNDGVIWLDDGTSFNLVEAAKDASRQVLAAQSFVEGLKDLGFGTDEEIDGADAVDAIGTLFEDVTTRVLAGKAMELPPVESKSAATLAMEACGDNFWNECDQYSKRDWCTEVSENDTVLGYWDWVASKAESDGVNLSDLTGTHWNKPDDTAERNG